MDDWNDLQFVLAVARSGALTTAAKTLGIDHSTAFRRLNALETRLGVRLFERLPGGSYALSPNGERMATAAERMEEEALAVSRDLTGSDLRLSGRLRVTSSETLAYRLLTGYIAAFRKVHPGIVVELAIDNRVLSLSHREADVALRPVRPKERELWGRKLADVAWAIYAARDFSGALTNGLRNPKDIQEYPLVGWDEAATGIAAAAWLSRIPASTFAFRSNSLVNQLVAAKAGMGLAILPCYLADPEPELIRLLPEPIPELAGELWIVTHADLRRTARIRAFFDLVGNGLTAERDLFEGKRNRPLKAATETRCRGGRTQRAARKVRQRDSSVR
jgi:DNA-binding transcriptional LysR family regulator